MEASRKLGAITLSIALFTGLSGSLLAWAAPNTIKGIELNSTPSSTEIVLRSEARIPHRVVARSAEKIVIDLSSVDPTRSIQTDFASAENIEQVILKPLTSDKVRMVIRGEDLAPPVVTSTSGRARNHHSGASLVYQQESAPSRAAMATATPKATAKVAAPAEDGFAMTTTTATTDPTKATTAPAAVSDGATAPESTNLEENFDLSDEELDASSTLNEQADADSENPPSERSYDRPPLVNTAMGESSLSLEEAEATPLDHLNAVLGSISEALKNQFGGSDKGILFQIAGISGILIMLGLFIRSKMSSPESLYPEETFNPVAKPSLLDKLFGGKKSKKGGRRATKAASFGQPKAQPTPRPPVRSNELPVGLNSLGQQYVPQAPAANPMLQQSQAMRQYAQQSSPPVNQAPMRRDRSEIDRELQRSVQMRQAVHQTQTKRPFQTPPQRPAAAPRPASNPAPARTPAAAAMAAQAPAPSRPVAPRPSAQQQPAAGLPANNTEVLEFLRNVAELMEKDGKANVAEGIKKGLMSRNQY